MRSRRYLRRRWMINDRLLTHECAPGSAPASAADEQVLVDDAPLAASAAGTPGASVSPLGTSGGRVGRTTPQSGRSRTGRRNCRPLTETWKEPLEGRANGASLPSSSSLGRCPPAKRQPLACNCQTSVPTPEGRY